MAGERANSIKETLAHSFAEQQGRTAPGPRGHHLLGSLLEVRRDRLKFVLQATQNYGDLICFRMGPKRLYLLNHPDYARHVLCDNVTNYSKGLGLAEAKPLLGKGLLTSEGELWASQRRLLQAAFQSKQMEEFSRLMIDAALSLLKRWEARADEHRPLNIASEMANLTINILGRTLFRKEFSELALGLSADLSILTEWAMTRMTSLLRIPLTLPTPRNLRAQRALRRLEAMVEKMIREHGSHNQSQDFLSLLAAKGHGRDARPSMKQMRDEVMTLLLAGHETTAATLAWTWYLLSRHPEVEHQLQEELDEVLEGRSPELSDLPRLGRLRAIIDEVLRLYPPVWLLPRKATNNDRLGGYSIPAGSDVLICVYTLHRHPDFWDDAMTFKPQRFAADNGMHHHSCVYLPFGAGPRTCIGSRFGMMEVMLVVALIAQRYSLRVAGGRAVGAEASLTLHPAGRSLMMRLQRRT